VPKKTQKETYETIVVGDTSALISLAVGSVLLKCLRISRILIPKEVYSELSEISQYNDVHGKAAQETICMISNGNIEVDKVEHVEKINELVSGHSHIDKGEAEALILAQEKSIPILITDDFRSIPDLKKNSGDVEIHLSIYLLARLVLEKIITIAEAQDALIRISDGRTWESAAIYNLAKKYINESK
jgi:predicted nucleic acid-binding protein